MVLGISSVHHGEDDERDELGMHEPSGEAPLVEMASGGGGPTLHPNPGGQDMDVAQDAAAAAPHLQRQMTRHVVTRWYRAPELPLYNDGHYSPAIDMWSMGCVYGEMLGMLDTGNPDDRYDRRALFPGGACAPMSKDRAKSRDGKPRKEQLEVIFEVLGTPTEDEIRRVRVEEVRESLRRLPPRKPEDLHRRFPGADAQALDMLTRFLRFLPEDRLTLDEALAHPFLSMVRRPHDEVGRPEGRIRFGAINPDNIRRLMVEEIRFFNRAIPANWENIALNALRAQEAASAVSDPLLALGGTGF